jgi:hypothetical protein
MSLFTHHARVIERTSCTRTRRHLSIRRADGAAWAPPRDS